jgi:Secretion system C-terminal sorting domain
LHKINSIQNSLIMKKISTLFILLITMLSAQLSLAQDRYVDEIFDEVSVTSNVVYGSNGTLLFFAQTMGNIKLQDLKMDIYEPVGDTQAERPLVLVFHTGNFLPPVTNGQIAGLKTDSSEVEICKQLARRGFTAASVTYRLGWNPLAASQPERALGLIQAAYRGVQDGRTAIRFFNKTYEEDGNPYHIDPSRITVWGNGTGGYLTLALTGLSFYEEIPLASNPAGKFLLDVNMDGTPETPMVVPAFHGDINGEVLTVVPQNAFGLMAGDTSNYPNHVGFSNTHHLGVNVGGALGDISWLADNTTPIISVQSPFDIFAPYDDAVLIVPTTGDPIVQVQGAKKIGEWLESSGTNQIWKDKNFNDPITLEAQNSSTQYGSHPFYEGVYPFYNAPNSNNIDEGVVLNWWNPTDPTPTTSPCMGLPWNQCPHPSGVSFHLNGLVLNEGMSAAKSKANIARIMSYVIPRACVALELECVGVTGTEEPLLDASVITIAPNPASNFVTLASRDNQIIQQVELYNMEGRLMAAQYDVNAPQTDLEVNRQTPGMYIVKIYTAEGIVAKKLSVK